MPDSLAIAQDTLVVEPASPTLKAVPWGVSRRDQAPLMADERAQFTTERQSYAQGMPPTPLRPSISTDSGVLTLLTVMFLLVAFNFKHCYRLFKVLGQELLQVRRRNNVFDDATTNEMRVLLVLLLQLWVCQGVLGYSWLSYQGYLPQYGQFVAVAAMVAVAMVFYLFQGACYKVVGYVFTDPISARQWIKGFSSSQAFLGVTLLIPALVSLFYPMWVMPMVFTALGLYILARIIFIIKGFRIFYVNLSSLLYFILYLCALEIIPVVIFALGTIELSRHFH